MRQWVRVVRETTSCHESGGSNFELGLTNDEWTLLFLFFIRWSDITQKEETISLFKPRRLVGLIDLMSRKRPWFVIFVRRERQREARFWFSKIVVFYGFNGSLSSALLTISSWIIALNMHWRMLRLVAFVQCAPVALLFLSRIPSIVRSPTDAKLGWFLLRRWIEYVKDSNAAMYLSLFTEICIQ